jgi:hypothetical protein
MATPLGPTSSRSPWTLGVSFHRAMILAGTRGPAAASAASAAPAAWCAMPLAPAGGHQTPARRRPAARI